MAWSLYEGDKFLKPLKFSNGKNQEDIVNEILELFNKGKRIVFIHGVCGSGKSGIALNLAKELGKSSIVVPSKTLQRQYKKDYENEKSLLKDNGGKLDIRVITGRNNHECKFLKENEKFFDLRKERDANLNNIFENQRKRESDSVDKDKSADNPKAPCKIEIKEKNMDKIREYLKQNQKVNLKNIGDIKDVKRLPLASVCPYWSPVYPKEYDLSFDNAEKREYEGLDGEKFVFYVRKPGCAFYEQFHSYIDADVIVFNALKYKIESLMNRKPLTEVEIIDECDEFLDGFSNQKSINLDLFENSLMYVPFDDDNGKDFKEMFEILKHLKKDRRVLRAVESEEIIPLKETGIYDLFRILLESGELFEYADEESYIFDVEETAKMFEGFLDETYVVFNRNKNNNQLIANVVTTNLSKKFQELIDKNKHLVLMSGTLHSEDVLRDVFGLKDFEIIEAETTQQGQIDIKRTGLEKNCKYSNFKNGNHSRQKYLEALDKCVEVSEKPTVVQVNGFNDLPNKEEKDSLGLRNLETRERVREKQSRENEEKTINDFKSGWAEVLFSTKVSRGVDFPGEECRSIVFTKYPNPNVKDAFWKILNQTKPLEYWKFYKDKARRELLQKIYRGLRFREDHLWLLSPDSRVLEAFE